MVNVQWQKFNLPIILGSAIKSVISNIIFEYISFVQSWTFTNHIDIKCALCFMPLILKKNNKECG
jgi:hypothetical protein